MVCLHFGRVHPYDLSNESTHTLFVIIVFLMTYKPIKDGIKKSSKLVTCVEVEPPSHLGNFVHCYWELKTTAAK